MIRVTPARPFSLAILVALAGCSGGGSTNGTGGNFVVLKTEPVDNATLFLNDAIQIDFSNPVDLDSVDLTTFSFEVRNQLGLVVAEPVAGTFEIGTSPGDAVAGRRLRFVPRLPTNDLFTNGGFRPGRTYTVQLVGGSQVNVTTMLDTGGKPLALPKSFRFSTADGTTPAQLFRNTAAGGPRRAGFEILPTPDAAGPEAGRVSLNKLGTPAVELRLLFDQPLNPSSTNVPVNIETSPLLRNSSNRGRIFLEYNDVVYGPNIWIPAEVELESNELTGATVILRPIGVLPNNATVRVIVEATLEDISGESNVTSGAAFQRTFATFLTRRSYDQQFDAAVDDFLDSSQVDLTAAFAEPFAEVGPGYLKSGFAFEGSTTGAEFEPTAPETVLNTDFTQVTPKQGAAYNVSGGIFNFQNVRIPAGKTVRGTGSNPMVWLVSGTFRVEGLLSVRGGNGVAVNTSGNANVSKAGGAGVCTGGNGGAGSPSTTARDIAGATGNGPLQVVGGGGAGGALSCTAGCGRGAGGGGGSLATQGDPNFKQKTQAPAPPGVPLAVFQQQGGDGGNGCIGAAGAVTRSLAGSLSGPLVFADARADNNFWGTGVRFDTLLRITGELAVPLGGGGGGGGGDLSFSNCDLTDINFENDSSGGGGGGGGGVLIVKALGPIVIADGGRITADGGSGGAGEASSSSSRGGGGGGGAGGMVILMSATSIDINVRGSNNKFRYAAPDNDYDFSISADGGVCVTGTQTPAILKKYQPTNVTTGDIGAAFATNYDAVPLGGFGGMGIVQLMAPPGANTDGTNTRLDDNINILRSTAAQTGAVKRDLIAWRGFPNLFGQGVDDQGNVITIGDNEGDIRPSPILLPTPFASKSRLRSNWIDTGASVRRGLAVDDNLPRGIVEQGGAQRGPRYEFDGVNATTGFVNYQLVGSSATVTAPLTVAATNISTVNANSTLLGKPAYRVGLATPALGTVVDRFAGYEAEILNGVDTLLGSFRIMSHTGSELVLSTEAGAFPATAAKARVRAKFFDVVTNGVGGLGSTYLGSTGSRVPISNVRIGFAFHQNPQTPAAQRFPANPNEYTFNLADPMVQETVRALGMAFVQWDIVFDIAYKDLPADTPPALSPTTPRTELRFLRLPYRF